MSEWALRAFLSHHRAVRFLPCALQPPMSHEPLLSLEEGLRLCVGGVPWLSTSPLPAVLCPSPVLHFCLHSGLGSHVLQPYTDGEAPLVTSGPASGLFLVEF